MSVFQSLSFLLNSMGSNDASKTTEQVEVDLNPQVLFLYKILNVTDSVYRTEPHSVRREERGHCFPAQITNTDVQKNAAC